MMNKPFYLLLILVSLSLKCFAQDSSSLKNGLSVEVGGNALLYSVNYERNLSTKAVAKGGMSIWKVIENQTNKSLTIMCYPVSFNYLFHLRTPKHAIETGMGVMNLITSGNLVEYKGVTNYYINPFLNVGYRYSPAKNPFWYGVGLSPFLGTKSLTHPTEQGFLPLGNNVQLWGYLRIGYAF